MLVCPVLLNRITIY